MKMLPVYLFFALLLASGLVWDVANASAVTTIYLQPEVTVTTLPVAMKDIARIDGEDTQTVSTLSELIVIKEIETGRLINFDQQLIKRRLIEKLGKQVADSLLIVGPNQIQIRYQPQRGNETVSLMTQANQHLGEWLSSQYHHYEIKPVSTIRLNRVSDRQIEYRLRDIQQTTAIKRMVVWLDGYVGDKRVHSIPVWFSVKAFDRVFVATEDIDIRSPLSPTQFKTDYRDVAAINARPVLPGHKLLRKRLTRPVKKNETLSLDAIESMPAVGWKQKVVVLVQSGKVHLQSAGFAMQDGDMGEQIKVRPKPESNEFYLATVVDHGVVRVSE